MFPSSPNIRITLLKITSVRDSIGNKGYQLISKKEVLGISKSVTSKEYYESKKEKFQLQLLQPKSLKALFCSFMTTEMLQRFRFCPLKPS